MSACNKLGDFISKKKIKGPNQLYCGQITGEEKKWENIYGMHFIGIGMDAAVWFVVAEVLIYSVCNSINGIIKMEEIRN